MAVADILVETNEIFYANVSPQNPLDTFLAMASVLIIDDDGKIELALNCTRMLIRCPYIITFSLVFENPLDMMAGS